MRGKRFNRKSLRGIPRRNRDGRQRLDGATNFIFNNKENLTEENADIIINFKKRRGDRIQIDGDLHGLPDNPRIKRFGRFRYFDNMQNEKYRRIDIAIVRQKTSKFLFINSQVEDNSFGNDVNNFDLLAIIKKEIFINMRIKK